MKYLQEEEFLFKLRYFINKNNIQFFYCLKNKMNNGNSTNKNKQKTKLKSKNYSEHEK